MQNTGLDEPVILSSTIIKSYVLLYFLSSHATYRIKYEGFRDHRHYLIDIFCYCSIYKNVAYSLRYTHTNVGPSLAMNIAWADPHEALLSPMVSILAPESACLELITESEP